MKNYLQKLLFVFVSVFLFAGCTINTTVKGKVSDKDDLSTIQGAKVTISYSKNSYETTTDENGNYSIAAKLPITEETNITVSKDDYTSSSANLLLDYKFANKIYTYDVALTKEQPEVVVEYGTISGTVKDLAGNLLSNVDVKIGNQITLTDENGFYSISNIVVAQNVSVVISKDGFAVNANVIDVIKDETSTLNFVLVKNDVVSTIDSTIDNTVEIKDAKVKFFANTFVKENGEAYTGNVTVQASFHQPSSYVGRLAFPGEYEGTRTDGTTTLLQSYGFFNIELLAEDGTKLNLSTNSTATLIYPADVNLEHTDATIPLWYYNNTLGIWVEEGNASYDSTTNTYTGTVSHFTVWNLDKPYARATVNCNVVDKNGIAVSGANITTIATSYFYQNVVTNSLGQCKIVVPGNLPFSISAKKGNDIGVSSTYTLNAGDNSDITIVLETYDSTNYKDITLKGNIIINNDYSYKYIYSSISNLTNGSSYYNYGENILSNIEIKIIDETKLSIVINAYSDNWASGNTTVSYANYEKTIELNIPAGFTENILNLGTIVLGESDITESGEYQNENEIIDCLQPNSDGICLEVPILVH